VFNPLAFTEVTVDYTVAGITIAPPAGSLTITGNPPKTLIPLSTYAVYDSTNEYLKIVVRNVEVMRVKPNGDVDVNGSVNQNAF